MAFINDNAVMLGSVVVLIYDDVVLTDGSAIMIDGVVVFDRR